MNSVLHEAGIKVIHGANDDVFDDIAGVTVEHVQRNLVDAFNLPPEVLSFVNGIQVGPSYRLMSNDTLEFCKQSGRKAVGDQVWTGEEFCQLFRITPEDLHAWIAHGLKVKTCLDGSIRITETSADEFFRGRVLESPGAEQVLEANHRVEEQLRLSATRKCASDGASQMLTTKEVSILLGCSYSEAREKMLDGRIKSVKDGRWIRSRKEWVEEYLISQIVKKPDQEPDQIRVKRPKAKLIGQFKKGGIAYDFLRSRPD